MLMGIDLSPGRPGGTDHILENISFIWRQLDFKLLLGGIAGPRDPLTTDMSTPPLKKEREQIGD
jgi:hypothetical protein